MRHIFFIDELSKLVIKKDSTLLLAESFQKKFETYFLFEKDFYITNKGFRWNVYRPEINVESLEVKKVSLGEELSIELEESDIIHMRLDPPFDGRYLNYLWMLRALEEKGIRVVNSAKGILATNEKISAYSRSSFESYVGSSKRALEDFIKNYPNDYFILKPLNLYQGIGVKKIESSDVIKEFSQMTQGSESIVVQPFVENVAHGEVRSIYFNGAELGSILKTPPQGEFLANIAQGATYKKLVLETEMKKKLDKISNQLLLDGIDFVAFDVLDNELSEINVTCPGLLVEVSKACEENLSIPIVNYWEGASS